MYRRRAYAIPSMTPVKRNGEEDIRSLGPAVGNEGFISRPLKVGIVEIHIRKAVPGRRKIDQSSAFAEKSCNAVHQNEVPQVIGAELHLEPIGSVAKGCGHNSGVSDNRVEGFAFREQSIGAGTHVLKAGQIELDHFEAAAA